MIEIETPAHYPPAATTCRVHFRGDLCQGVVKDHTFLAGDLEVFTINAPVKQCLESGICFSTCQWPSPPCKWIGLDQLRHVTVDASNLSISPCLAQTNYPKSCAFVAFFWQVNELT